MNALLIAATPWVCGLALVCALGILQHLLQALFPPLPRKMARNQVRLSRTRPQPRIHLLDLPHSPRRNGHQRSWPATARRAR